MSTVIRIHPFHKTTVDLDGRELRVRIRRFSVDDLAEYSRLEAAMSQRREDRVLLVRTQPDELERIVPTETQVEEHAELLETAKGLEARTAAAGVDELIGEVFGFLRSVVARLTPVERYRIPDDEIRRRRDQALTPAQRKELDAYRNEEQAASDTFMQFVLGFVTVEPGQIEIEEEIPGSSDGDAPTTIVRPLTSADDILRFYGGHLHLLGQLMKAVRRHNLMTEAEKNGSRSRSGSTRSSGERGPAAGGPRPDAVVTPAASGPSAQSEVVTASTAAPPSGAMAASSS